MKNFSFAAVDVVSLLKSENEAGENQLWYSAGKM